MKVLLVHRPGAQSGGDWVALNGYVQEIRRAGIEIKAVGADQFTRSNGYDVIHLWAACSPDWGLKVALDARASNKPLIVTPFWWSRSERQAFYGRPGEDLAPGYTDGVEMILGLADVLFPVTMSEAVECWKLAPGAPVQIVPMGTDVQPPKPLLEGFDDYVLSIGRIEPHKNQLSLAAAAKHLGMRVKLIGHGSGDYFNAVVNYPGVDWFGTVDETTKYRLLERARVHALPSFFENPGLAHAEAARFGVPAVMGGHGCEPEFFGAGGIYCDPTSVRDIERALVVAWDRKHYQWADVPTWSKAVKPALDWMRKNL